MATTAYTGLGAKLERSGVTIAYVTEIGGVSLKQAAINITNQQSTSDFEEFLGGLLSVSSVSLKGFFKPGDTTGQVGLHTDLLAHTLQSWVLTYDAAAATTWTFSALVEEFTITGVTIDNAIEFSASLKVSGKPTIGITASGGLTGLTGVDSVPGALVFVPVFNNAVYLYGVSVTAAVTHVHFTPTAASHTITITCLGVSQTVPTTTESAAITIGAVDTMTEVTITAVESGKVPVEYTIYVKKAAS